MSRSRIGSKTTPVERAAGVLARDAHAPLRDAEQEVDGPVERVDDPAQPARARPVVALLAEDRVVGPRRLEPRADQPLGRDVRLGDEVCRRALRADRQAAVAEPRRTPRAARRRPRARSSVASASSSACRLTRRARDGGRASPWSASSWAESESSVASSPVRPTSWTATGRPLGRRLDRHRRGGLARVVPQREVRREVRHRR